MNASLRQLRGLSFVLAALSLIGCTASRDRDGIDSRFQVANTTDEARVIRVLAVPDVGGDPVIDRAYDMQPHTKTNIEEFFSPDSRPRVDVASGNLSASEVVEFPSGLRSLHVRVDARITIQLAVPVT